MAGFFSGSELVRKAPRAKQPQCGACGLHKKCTNPKMPVQGRGGLRVLFIGSGVTEEADRAGRHLAGPALHALSNAVAGLGHKLPAVAWVTNATICKGEPDTTRAMHCEPNWWDAVQRLRPDVIVPMGEAACATVVGRLWGKPAGGIDRWVGQVVPDQTTNAWVCPIWDPGHIANEKDAAKAHMWHDHLAAALACCGVPWPDGPPNWAGAVQCIQDDTKAADMLDDVASRTCGVVAWDYEANCLKPEYEGAALSSVAVSWGTALSGPAVTVAALLGPKTKAALRRLLRCPLPKIAANIKFEDRWSRVALGTPVRNWVWDTMLAAHVLDNRKGVTGVKYQAYAKLGQPVWDSGVEDFLKSTPNTKLNDIQRQVSVRDLLLYNGMDALLEYRLACQQLTTMGLPTPWDKND